MNSQKRDTFITRGKILEFERLNEIRSYFNKFLFIITIFFFFTLDIGRIKFIIIAEFFLSTFIF